MIIHSPRQKSKPKKPNAKQRELDTQWQQLMSQYKPKKVEAKVPQYSSPKVPANRSTRQFKSVDSGIGNASLPEQKVYTGDKIIGISQMAKSNAVPVFNTDHILEIARMRR